jgi:hypothetical protein
MPPLFIYSSWREEPAPVDIEEHGPELPSLASVYLARWGVKIRSLFRWRTYMPSSAVDICELRQTPAPGNLRVWSGGQGYTLRESGPEGHIQVGIKPFDFALFQHARLIANLRERQASFGRINYLEGTATLTDRADWSRIIVEVRSEGQIFMTAELLSADEAGSEARQYADRIPRDRATNYLLHPGGARF